MTKEEKQQLLLKDLCARFLYHVIVQYRGANVDLTQYSRSVKIEDCKPYLRTMSSMTEEEKKELKEATCPDGTGYFDEQYLICPMSHYGECISYDFMSNILDWLNAHHFDYRGLIEKGLALKAECDMYK